jgi:hypothetical protein
MGMTKGCFRTCWFQTVIKYGFEFNEAHKAKANAIIGTMGGRKYDDDGDEYKVYRDKTKFASEQTKAKAPKTKWRPIGLFKRS